MASPRSGTVMQPMLSWFRSFKDPLASANNAARWIGGLPTVDAATLQKEALELVAGFPGTRKEAGPGQVEALLRVDGRVEPIIAQLTQQYAQNHGKSTSIESRLWHSVFDLVKAFIAAYQLALKAGYPRADNKRWRAILPWVIVRLAHYRGLDGKYRLFRYSHWIPAQWREFHELYEFARMRGWQREQLVFGVGAFAKPGVSFEQEYLKTLLLMRLDSGNFTPDQVEWVARQLEDWTPTLALTPPPSEGAPFVVDLSGTAGLRRRERAQSGGRVLFLDAGPVYARIVERLRWLPEQDAELPKGGDLPVREQRLLLMRLASLYGPDAIAQAPRAPRIQAESEVRVVVGLQALTRAVAEIDRLPDQVRTPGVAASFDEVTQIVNPNANPESVARRIRGTTWRMTDRSDTGCRLTAPAKDAPAKLGELLAIKEGDLWMLAVVRRMQKLQVDEVTVGAEIIARRLVRVLMRTWVTPSESIRTNAERPFFGIYLPAHPDNRQSSQRSLIGPEDKFSTGGMVELDTGNARYLIRFTQTLEQQAGWSWAMFNAVRKLSG
ncbi:MAG TPA: hypothetical protein VMN56_14390 [Casimicrobiaceae bacterium]|nr:hypothetical protein [Casimicrobiaceae bacterium]